MSTGGRGQCSIEDQLGSALVALLTNPDDARAFPLEAIREGLCRIKALEAELVTRLLTPSSQEVSGDATDPDRLLTIPEVAFLLGVPRGCAYDLARRGELPTVLIGKY